MENFNVVLEKKAKTLTVRIIGQLDAVNAPKLEARLRPELDSVRHVVVDFEKVDYVSSAGLRVLLMAEQKMELKGGGMTLMNVRPVILEIFEITGFLDMVSLEN